MPVQPKVEIVDWRELEVGRPDGEVPEELVSRSWTRCASRSPSSFPPTGVRHEGDTLIVDIVSPDGEAQRDTVVELGSGRLVEEVDAALTGASAGETKSVSYELADESRATVEVHVKEIKGKVLPELDDELARSASEFDTLAELRADIEGRLREQIDAEIENAFRANAADALVTASKVTPAGPLVESRTRELLNGFVRSLERRGITPDTYLELTGRTAEQPGRRRCSSKRRSRSRVSLCSRRSQTSSGSRSRRRGQGARAGEAEASGDDPDEVIDELWHHGRQRTLRGLCLRAALDPRRGRGEADSARAGPGARGDLDVPDKETPDTETKLRTPGSKETA